MTTESVHVQVQDHTGDRKIKLHFHPDEPHYHEEMQRFFQRLQDDGCRLYSVKKVLGLIPVKGKEIDGYDPLLEEVIVKRPTVPAKLESSRHASSVKMQEVTEDEVAYPKEDPKPFNAHTDKLDTTRDYVASKPLRAG